MFATVLYSLMAVLSATDGSSVSPAVTSKAQLHLKIVYFHRTVRCPTCKRIGTLAAEAVTTSFPREIEQGTVHFSSVDFQDEKNAKLVDAYKIKTPTLVLIRVEDGHANAWAPLPRVWQLVAKPDELKAYVHDVVAQALHPSGDKLELKE